jgi:hypothetical protein
MLHLIELMAGLSPCQERKGAQVIKGASPELKRLGINH